MEVGLIFYVVVDMLSKYFYFSNRGSEVVENKDGLIKDQNLNKVCISTSFVNLIVIKTIGRPHQGVSTQLFQIIYYSN